MSYSATYDENGKFIPYHNYKIVWKLKHFSSHTKEWAVMEEGRSYVTTTRSPEAAKAVFLSERTHRVGLNTRFEIVSVEYDGESTYGGPRYRNGWY
ncbi:MAG: hypothetical protein EBS53_15180 [Bacteroidetes bacterium]|nr:hypothetical protein [Verrucomicrobiota bacterium]NBU72761.1 hypothetical protein [Bacteroidota bacterium]